MRTMQGRQTKTTAKMTVAEVIITAHSVVSPQVRSAQLGGEGGQEDVPHFGLHHAQDQGQSHAGNPDKLTPDGPWTHHPVPEDYRI